MALPLQDALALCKIIQRNGFDAYIISPSIQLDGESMDEVDIATELAMEDLIKLFPGVDTPEDQPLLLGQLEENGVLFRFYPTDLTEASHPEATVVRLTARLLDKMSKEGESAMTLACSYSPRPKELYEGFQDLGSGEIRFCGLPDETLKRNYLLGIRALRFAANYRVYIEANTWAAITRAATRILDYVSISDIMDEFRKVEAENLWLFVRMLFDANILHRLVPEVAALTAVKHIRNDNNEEQSVFDHTLEVMRRYPEELPFDWFGCMACLFHDVGKLYTAEFANGRWTFNQHHRVGAKVTRKVLKRLRFQPEDIDLICHLVQNHLRFKYMLTDRGARRFIALDEYPRLIEMARADIKARDARYTEFNHNLKMLERAETPEEMLEPLLNGNEIMEFTGLKPGPAVGLIRDALLKAQIAGEVTSVPEAVEFVVFHSAKELFPQG